ncbi:SAM-dependent methyltransferase [Ammoniphilus oxalaticus]|uniref:SAM-dependent methyltransferase n=1 Tax=Ammoniphilus oxalaticus TaxID=66863 RepID=A0A419SP26_9BACL|nr:methyltransferase [Ammoniphilus oxalaticus]RKD25992.1 SAM-dependent methyltransferase [Ammoniphilus oxalaticus]
MEEHDYDRLLNIRTVGAQKGFDHSLHYHRYEPTPYYALHALFETYKLNPSDRIVDFGSGKGRLNFYIHYLFKASVIGVEMNEGFYRDALGNYTNYTKKYRSGKNRIEFHCGLAELYSIHPADNRFYFFNPFSIQIFMKVVQNILLSYEAMPRELELLLYYPSEDYTYFLENNTPFALKEEVVLKGVYEHSPYERFSIYTLDSFCI